MPQKPSFKALQNRVKALERVEEDLRNREGKYRQLVEAADAVMFIADYDGTYLFLNRLAAEMVGGRPDDYIGQTVFDIFPQKMAEHFLVGIRRIIDSGIGNVDVSETMLKGKRYWYKTIGQPIRDRHGEIYAAMFIGIDETELVEAQEKLAEYTDNLEKMVKDRTRELELQSLKLEQSNIALKVLLKKQEKDKFVLQEQILSNVKKLIIPYMGVLREHLDNGGQNILDLLNANLVDITSGFACALSSEKYGLTPAEMLVADLIRRGSKTKEIGELNDISYKTVEVHRNNIRKKLGLTGQKINLQTYLRTLAQ